MEHLQGWIGGGCATDVIIEAAKCAIVKGEPKLVRISNEKIYAEEDVEHYTMSCASNGSVELFIQPNSLRSALCVLGTHARGGRGAVPCGAAEDPAHRQPE